MITYAVTKKELLARIKKHDAKWQAAAAAETAKLKHGDKVEKSLWSRIKQVYMDIQCGKCIFCESLLGASGDFDLIKQDVEHFRPKNSVQPWPSDTQRRKLKVPADLPVSVHETKGYTFLAYHPFNYAASCKTCNSTLKGDHFPTVKLPAATARDPDSLAKKEQPYLIYPLGSLDTDARSLITFAGILPIAAQPKSAGHDHDRGRVTIAFFGLALRDDLLFARASLISHIGDIMEKIALLKDKKKIAAEEARITAFKDPAVPHSSCASSFIALRSRNPAKADELLAAARDFIVSYTKRLRPANPL